MLIDLTDVSSIRKQVEVEIPAEAVNTAFRTVTTEFARQAKVPGFRPGKTPAEVVRKRFKKEIESEVLDRLLPEYFTDAISGKDIEPVGSPGVKRVDVVEEGKPVRFVAEFEVKPEVELRNWEGIDVTEPPLEVSEEDVDAIVERYRDASSTFVPVEGRGAEDGDYVVVDIVSRGEGVETRTSEGYPIQLGDEAPMPELNDALRGKKAGETAEFDKAYGDDAPNEQVRGKTIQYAMTVRDVKRREKPEVDDELAKSANLGDSVEAMRERIREDLRKHKEQEARNAKRQQVGHALVERHPIEAPQVLLMREMERSMRNYARYLASQGVDIEQADLDWEEIGRNLEPEAINRVKLSLILEEIAKKEGIAVSDVEVDAEIRSASSGTDQEYAEVRQRLRADGGYEALRASMAQERALDLAVERANVVSK
ncbi:MAG: trigger factor [Thermoanaerobaculia bacterium]